ncbi:MAG: cytochrome c oxidase assembly protein [Proteobacteria bacterium]|nr:cytochrome c oxidase assembly protein [Pseudomonadota bacterium]
MSQRDKKRHTTLLLALAVGMFGFAFALVPLYDVFCEITGLNGKTSGQAELLAEIDRSAAQEDREVKIEFLASVARGMPWEFRPMDKEIIVRPGTMNKTTFFVRNRSNKTVIGQAVPSVSPGQAAQYLKKIECFCFEQQELMAGAEMEMGVTFYVDAELPAHINELTLSYTMFLVSDLAGSNEHEHLSSHNVR